MSPPQSPFPGTSGRSAEEEPVQDPGSANPRQLGPGRVQAPPTPDDIERPDQLLGTMLDGRYHLIERIATSAMSRVYRAHQPALGREVAVKLLYARDPTADVEMYKRRFEREAASLARLAHPNIVRVYDHGSHGGMPFLVMEFIRGETLREYCGGRAIAPLLAIEVIDQLAKALREAHRMGLVHRDLKPANVFVKGETSAELVVRLVDFGIAKDATDASDITGVDSVLGTPWYMAPEQAIGDPVDGRTDIYALGVLLYRLLVGRTPYSHLRGASVLVAHINTPVPAFSSVLGERDTHLPTAVEWTTRRCLEKPPEARFRDVGELRRALKICRVALAQPDRPLRMELNQGVLKVLDDITHIPPDTAPSQPIPIARHPVAPVPPWAWLVPVALMVAFISLWMPPPQPPSPARPASRVPVRSSTSADLLAAAALESAELADLAIRTDDAGLHILGTLQPATSSSMSGLTPVGRLEQHDDVTQYVLVLSHTDNHRMPARIPLDGTLATAISLSDTDAGLELTVRAGTDAWGVPQLTSTDTGFELHIPPEG